MQPLPVLKADCSACAALCCMAPPFDRGADFALDKPALHPCPHLDHHRCTIHDSLERQGFPGCARYDCLGAGQRVVQEVFKGTDWRQDATLRAPMGEAFSLLRRIHAELELILAAARLPLPEALEAEQAALRAAWHPRDGWTLQGLRTHAASDLPRRLQRFLAALRAHV